MDIKEQVFAYLVDTEEDSAADLIRESEFESIFEDVLFPMDGGFDEYYLCRYHIRIKAKYLKGIGTVYAKEKELIEEALKLLTQNYNEHIRLISWLPLPRMYSEIVKYNQNDKLKQYLVAGDIGSFFTDVRSLFASLPYNMKTTEAFFHSNIHVLLRVLGFDIVSEDETNLGRIDSVIELDNTIYIVEFKTSDASVAIEQIKDKKYYEKYLSKRKEIVLVGVGCSLAERNVASWNVEKYVFE